ncbi:MAG: hypothetical protein ACHQET_07780 [Chitinophagales bacterium]
MALVFFGLTGQDAMGQQITVRGTVYNMYRTRPLDAVSVISTSGRGTITDSSGTYALLVDESDSISFSYLGRSTVKYPVRDINHPNGFDIALHVNPTELSEVRIAPKNYRLDSLRNREEYEKIFNYHKPGLALTDPSSGSGVGVDLDQIINMFRFARNRRMLAFQRRLIEEEHDKFIDHRFNRSIVKKITHLDGDELDAFMAMYRPSYEFTESTTDYEFYDYIKLAYKEYKSGRKKTTVPKKDE